MGTGLLMLWSIDHTLIDTRGVLPGALETVRSLHDRSDIVSTVLTAEPRPTALAKLQDFGLDDYLRTDRGVFGDDAPDQAEPDQAALVEAAWRRNAMAFGPQNTVMIGATPDIVAAGQSHGVFVIGVATGEYTEAQLRDAGANAVLPDLTVFRRVQALIDRGQPA